MKLRERHDAGWAVFESAVHHDERGWLVEALRTEVLQHVAGEVAILQQNLSHSRQGVLRGLHYQLGAPQGKLLRLLRGRARDVIVDLRRHSPWFGRHFVFELAEDDSCSLWVPPGFAHGFFAREECLLMYSLTQPWDASLDRAVRWDSPALAIDWRLNGAEPILSARDRDAPLFGDAQVFDDADFR